ncbi:MAG: DUF4097 family beta strand repeat protein [Clostridia bacterium]|nr:DUF4097 family beta strand repeat protein [Clostridia bacterium]
MKKSTVIWIIIAVLLIIIGAAIAVGSIVLTDWDIAKEKESLVKTVTVTEAFDGVTVNSPAEDIVFIRSDDGVCRVEYTEQKDADYTVKVKDGMLTVGGVTGRKWYDYIGVLRLFSKDSGIKIYLPGDKYAILTVNGGTGDINIPKGFAFKDINIKASTGDVECAATVLESCKIGLSTGDIMIDGGALCGIDLTATTGDITVKNIDTTGDIKANVSTGDISLSNVRCMNLTSTGSTGDMVFKDVTAQLSFYLERSTGSVEFDGCDAGEIMVKTTTGDVCGTLLSEKIFFTETSTGDIKVPKSLTGGKCEVKTSTGDIILDVGH